jgi:hypothetical protein
VEIPAQIQKVNKTVDTIIFAVLLVVAFVLGFLLSANLGLWK